MRINQRDLIVHELIGSVIEIVGSRNETLIGIKGRVVDETQNTLLVETKSGKKKIIKSQVVLVIKKNKVKGKCLVGRPEDRIKK